MNTEPQECLKSAEKAKNVISQKPDVALLSKLRSLLTANSSSILPPGNRMPIQELLDAYNEGLKQEKDVNEGSEHRRNSIYTLSESRSKELEWPESYNTEGLGVGLHYNKSNFCEEIESMSLNLIDRIIGGETLSSYNEPPVKSSKLVLDHSASASSRRLSHLARRRAVFSSANGISKICRQISLSTKAKSKKSVAEKNKTPKKKSPETKKCVPLSIAIRPPATRETSKRALFQSPKTSVGAEIISSHKRALFSPDRHENSFKRRKIENIQELQPHHKQKLLWAVATALKNKNISSSDENYKKYAHILSKVVKYFFQQYLGSNQLKSININNKLTESSSTSEKMKRIANNYVYDVINGMSLETILQKGTEYINTSGENTLVYEEMKDIVKTSISHKSLPYIRNDTVLRENIDTQLRQKSAKKDHQIENVVANDRIYDRKKEVKRQISF